MCERERRGVGGTETQRIFNIFELIFCCRAMTEMKFDLLITCISSPKLTDRTGSAHTIATIGCYCVELNPKIRYSANATRPNWIGISISCPVYNAISNRNEKWPTKVKSIYVLHTATWILSLHSVIATAPMPESNQPMIDEWMCAFSSPE